MNLKRKALKFATNAHKGQKRKVTGIDYITHPAEVAQILQKNGYRDEVVAAGYLHDVVEDTPYTLNDIKKEFGKDVAQLVNSNTETKDDQKGEARPWKIRKTETIEAIAHKSEEELALLIADKLANIRSFSTDIQLIFDRGEKITDHFNKSIEDQVWYYETIANEAIKTSPQPSALFYEYKEKVDEFKKVIKSF
jgi:(p)ppGpp synthase/HD superfamily hydrolase